MSLRRSRAILLWGAALVGLATVARLIWVLSVPTVPVSDAPGASVPSPKQMTNGAVLWPGTIDESKHCAPVSPEL